ncbi:MAG: DnaA regulatory inactivator Hda [Thiomonas sp. 20-64-5]|nr:MAG: DnaA regulatory inactivator Hda [Thiomonas sp. 20-64-5]
MPRNATLQAPPHASQAARQQILPLDWEPDQTLDNFDPGTQRDNALVLQALNDLLQQRSHGALYVWGETGSGKSHLLWAACHAQQRQDRWALLLTPQTPASAWPDVSDLLAQSAGGLLAVDDTQHLCEWQQDWLFGLYNAARTARLAFLASGNATPAALPLRADLRTRLSWGLALRLSPPDDTLRARVLQRLAHDRGYTLSPELLHYMLTHLSRDLSRLAALMAAFDRYALATQRPATVPLLKSLLAEQPQLLQTAPPGIACG